MVKQEKLIPKEKKDAIPRDPQKAAFNKRKKELHSLYKQYKVGIITDEDLTDEQRFYFQKYFGVQTQE